MAHQGKVPPSTAKYSGLLMSRQSHRFKRSKGGRTCSRVWVNQSMVAARTRTIHFIFIRMLAIAKIVEAKADATRRARCLSMGDTPIDPAPARRQTTKWLGPTHCIPPSSKWERTRLEQCHVGDRVSVAIGMQPRERSFVCFGIGAVVLRNMDSCARASRFV
jgi:hypothetical protein